MGCSNSRLVGLSLAFLAATACGDAEEADGSRVEGEATQYVLGAGLFLPGNRTSYVGLTPSLGPHGEIVMAETIEVPGISLLYVREGQGEFFVDSITELLLTKYEVDDGRILQRGQLSFARLGFSSDSRLSHNVFVSDSRAFLVDSSTLQLVEWNPSTMEIVDTERLEGLARDDGSPLVYAPVVRDEKAFFPFAYFDEQNDFIRPEAVMLVLDLESREYEVISDDSCGDGVYPMLTSTGDMYLASGVANGALEYLGREGVGQACLRRIPAGSEAFDPDYHPTFRELTGGQVGGGIARGPDDTALVRVLDPSALPPGVATSGEMLAVAAWAWWRIDFSSGLLSPTTLDLSAGRFTVLSAESRTFVTLSERDFSRTVLLEVGVDPPVVGVEVSGIASGLGRL